MSDGALRDLVSRLVQEEGDLSREDVDALCVVQVLDKQICHLISEFCPGLVGTTDLEMFPLINPYTALSRSSCHGSCSTKAVSLLPFVPCK